MLNVKSAVNGSNSISYLGPKILDIEPLELKALTSVAAFKKSIKEMETKKTVHIGYLRNLGIQFRIHYVTS